MGFGVWGLGCGVCGLVSASGASGLPVPPSRLLPVPPICFPSSRCFAPASSARPPAPPTSCNTGYYLKFVRCAPAARALGALQNPENLSAAAAPRLRLAGGRVSSARSRACENYFRVQSRPSYFSVLRRAPGRPYGAPLRGLKFTLWFTILTVKRVGNRDSRPVSVAPCGRDTHDMLPRALRRAPNR